jgi:Holin of 3TMs, for gene-transfer release
MGMMAGLLGAGGVVKDVAEVFTANATRRMELGAEAQAAAMTQFGAEFGVAPQGGFDRFVNGLNRLPRPMLAFGTLGLFGYAMVDPVSFTTRMVGLNAVPEPLWWLLGAVVGFYFGAREAHYFRVRPGAVVAPAAANGPVADENAAVADWRVGA